MSLAPYAPTLEVLDRGAENLCNLMAKNNEMDNTRIESNGLLNARLILNDMKTSYGKVQLSLWGRNLTNADHIDNFIDFGPGFGNLTQAYYNQPRLLGVSAAFKW